MLVVAGVACSDDTADGKPTVVASFYPLAFAAEEIGGGDVTVRNLTSPGAEPHDLELSPRDADRIEDADVVLVLGRDFQPAVERVAERNDNAVEVLSGINAEGADPHVWLDPILMADVVDVVAAALSRAVLDHQAGIAKRAMSMRERLERLDATYKVGLANCQRKTIVTAHESFGRLAARYGLTDRGITGISPEAEPNPAKMAELADLIEDTGITTVFTEELVSPRVAQALAREAGVKTDVLDPIEGLETGDYFSAMESNLTKLRRALACT